MIELIDNSTNKKLMAMILCGIKYDKDCYLIYCVQRDSNEANVFVSKLIKGSLGYVIDNNFSNGEKEVLDKLVKRLLSKENKDLIEGSGYCFINDIKMDSNLYFDINDCYVSTVSKNLIKECLIFYGLVSKSILERPVVEVKEDKRKFNEGFINNIVLIIFGISVLIFSGVVLYNILFK